MATYDTVRTRVWYVLARSAHAYRLALAPSMDVLLTVTHPTIRCCGMPEDSRTPFCRDGGCYNCEVEIEEASELVRSAQPMLQ